MTVLVIRTHKRFAVRRNAQVGQPDKGAAGGLLIEVSLEGCRISNIDETRFAIGEPVSVAIDGFDTLDAQVRWVRAGFVGLRFMRPLHSPGLDSLIRTCRGQADDAAPLRAYGT